MAAPQAQPPDYHFTGTDADTIKVKVQCDCGIHARNFRGIREGVEYLRHLGTIPPHLPVMCWRCRECKQTVVITARQLGLAA